MQRASERAHSRKLTVASSAKNLPFYGGQSSVTPCSCCLLADIDTSAARICYKDLQIVAAELPENLSCVAIYVCVAGWAAQD
jgi:hypothetical protein